MIEGKKLSSTFLSPIMEKNEIEHDKITQPLLAKENLENSG